MKAQKANLLSVATLMILLLGLSTSAWSAGFQLFNEMSARSAAMGSAVVARSDIAELAWFNPAGAAMMERAEVMAGMSFVVPSMEFDNDNGKDWEMKDHVFPLPHVYMATPLGKYFGASLAINAPYGLTTDWDRDWAGNTYAVYTDLKTIYISPSLAFSPCDFISISAGPHFVYADAELKKYAFYNRDFGPSLGLPVPVLASVYSRLKGDDWGYGYQVSMMIKPMEKFQIGLTYHSEVDLDLSGDAKFDISGNPALQPTLAAMFRNGDMWLDLTLPSTFTIGLTTTIIENWRFSADFMWTGWGCYRSLDFEFENSPYYSSVPKKWNDVWSYRFGVEYTMNPQWQFRASYVYDESPIPDDYRDPSLPTNDRHVFGFGVGWNMDEHFGLDAGYTYVYVEDGDPGEDATPTLDGEYQGDAHIFNVSLRWTF